MPTRSATENPAGNPAEKQTDFYQAHLDRVSRSFSFCIAELRPPLREWISLAYLLCRVVDTVEDSHWHESQAQKKAFAGFIGFLTQYEKLTAVGDWVASFPASLPEREQLLLRDAEILFRHLHTLDEKPRKVLTDNILNMARGMDYFCSAHKEQNVLRLSSLEQTNQYCFFVAGVVGEMLTQLAALAIKNFPSRRETSLNAVHFGLFLQKINILKDQLGDETQGRHFIPSRELLTGSLRHHAERAFAYLQDIPPHASDYRTFCSWSLFIGLASLPWIEKSWAQRTPLKISRWQTFLLKQKISAAINDNAQLNRLFEEYTSEMPNSPQTKSPLSRSPWLTQVYQGPLTPSDFQLLGL